MKTVNRSNRKREELSTCETSEKIGAQGKLTIFKR